MNFSKMYHLPGIIAGIILLILTGVIFLPVVSADAPSSENIQADNPDSPADPVKLIFIHHSTGGNWLADPNDDQPYGGLGLAMRDNNYFVSATNYGWGPDSIGDRTDIPNWPEWFTGASRDTILSALYTGTGQNVGGFGDWSRLDRDPGGENVIIMFKSCFPNSALEGGPTDLPYAGPNDWEYSVSNAKAVYNDLLTYFATRPDKLFVVITAPALAAAETSESQAANARAFNTWLVNDWLAGYPAANVAVFDYYNVLTAPENHHRWNGSTIEHVQATGSNVSAYPSGDSHPSTEGHRKATAEFVPLLNVWYHRWQAGLPPASVPPPAVETPSPEPSPLSEPTMSSPTPGEPESPPAAVGLIEDFEAAELQWWPDLGEGAAVECGPDNGTLRLTYDVPAQSWGGCGLYFDQPQDWSAGHGLSLWMRADRPGQWLTLAVFSGNPDSPTPFETHFELPVDGKELIFAWSDLPKAEWSGDEGLTVLDPAQITGLGLSLGANETARQGVLWVDNIELVSAGPAPAPTSPEPAVSTPTPTSADSAVAPTASAPPTATSESKAGSGGGLCGSITLPLGGIAVWGLGRRRRPASG